MKATVGEGGEDFLFGVLVLNTSVTWPQLRTHEGARDATLGCKDFLGVEPM